MNWSLVIIIPLIGALIGWITNVLAVYLLFRPYKAFKIPMLPWKIQGVIPKRQKELAKSIGEVVEEQLLTPKEIARQLENKVDSLEINNAVLLTIRNQALTRLPAWIPLPFREAAVNYFSETLKREIPGILFRLKDQITADFKNTLDFREIVEEKINSLEMQSLEELVLLVARRELRYIELFGAVLGFLIGLIQLGVFLLAG